MKAMAHVCASSVSAASLQATQWASRRRIPLPTAHGPRTWGLPHHGAQAQKRRARVTNRPAASYQPLTEASSQLVATLAEAMDPAPEWTLDQAVGLVFAGLLVALYLSSRQVDAFVARAQRRQLGLCEACGGLYQPAACTQAGCPMKGKSGSGGEGPSSDASSSDASSSGSGSGGGRPSS